MPGREDLARIARRQVSPVVAHDLPRGRDVGVACALAATQLLRGQLVGVTPTDPLTLAASILLLGAVAFIACWLPARRATKVDPMVALRAE